MGETYSHLLNLCIFCLFVLVASMQYYIIHLFKKKKKKETSVTSSSSSSSSSFYNKNVFDTFQLLDQSYIPKFPVTSHI